MPGSVPARPLAAWAVLAAEAVAVLVFAVWTAVTAPVFSPVDEAQHVDYVDHLVDDHGLPELDQPVDGDVLAVGEGTYPAPAPDRARGLSGTSYEAFQPPLYYLAAAPVYAVTPGTDHKVTALRLFGVALLGVAIAVTVLLLRDLFGASWPAPAAVGLLVLALPGVVARSAIVGNGALELPLGAVLALLLVRVWRDGTVRQLLLASLVLGLLLLTKLTAVFLVVPVAVVVLRWWWQRRADGAAPLGWLAAAAAIPLVLLSPWLAWNQATYGSLTATRQAQDGQRPVVLRFGYEPADVVNATPALVDAVTPEEAQARVAAPWPALARALLLGLLVVAPPVVLVAVGGRRRVALLLGLPLLSGAVLLPAWSLLQRFPAMAPRYLYVAAPAWAGLVAAGWLAAVRSSRALLRVAVIGLVAVLVVQAAVVGVIPLPRPAEGAAAATGR